MNADNIKISLKDQIIKAVGSGNDDNGLPKPVIRYRPTSYQTPKHDVKGDAILLAIEQFQQKGINYDGATWLSYDFVKRYKNELQINEDYIFKKEIYEPLDSSMWCSNVIKYVAEYLSKINSGEIDCPEKPTSWSQFKYSYCAQRNKRQKMEDKFIALPTLEILGGNENTAFFGVFDGHVGAEISSYCAAHFARIIVDLKCENNVETLKKAFEIMDERINIRCTNESIRSGTTAVCAIVTRKKVSLAWVGDSEGAVIRKNGIERITRLHIPSDEEEQKRVEDCGGIVIPVGGELRVCGVLNLTRALGDLQGKPMISSLPDVTSFSIDEEMTNYMLMLASDGIWGSLSDKELNSIITKFISLKSITEYKNLSSVIVEAAKDAGASDNLTCVIVYLKPLEEVWKMFG
uniref:PPM-type phosphatase domain-containing protein n=1 Tax=Parastrongyloides trichosuri TaxID=131310 RepID=A0A0N4ZXA8_PARTI